MDVDICGHVHTFMCLCIHGSIYIIMHMHMQLHKKCTQTLIDFYISLLLLFQRGQTPFTTKDICWSSHYIIFIEVFGGRSGVISENCWGGTQDKNAAKFSAWILQILQDLTWDWHSSLNSWHSLSWIPCSNNTKWFIFPSLQYDVFTTSSLLMPCHVPSIILPHPHPAQSRSCKATNGYQFLTPFQGVTDTLPGILRITFGGVTGGTRGRKKECQSLGSFSELSLVSLT